MLTVRGINANLKNAKDQYIKEQPLINVQIWIRQILHQVLRAHEQVLHVTLAS